MLRSELKNLTNFPKLLKKLSKKSQQWRRRLRRRWISSQLCRPKWRINIKMNRINSWLKLKNNKMTLSQELIKLRQIRKTVLPSLKKKKLTPFHCWPNKSKIMKTCSKTKKKRTSLCSQRKRSTMKRSLILKNLCLRPKPIDNSLLLNS